MTVDISALFSVRTFDDFVAIGLDVAQAFGLPVTTWRTGDPTKSLYSYLARALEPLDGTVSDYIKAGFLSTAEGDWLTILAKETFGVDRTGATYATPSITLVNGGGGFYDPDPGDLSFKSTASGKTFHTTDSSDGPLSAGATRTYALVADEAGSDSSVAADEIDGFITPLLGVTISTSGAAPAGDAESDEALKQRCLDTLGALSPNGAADAYRYVALNPELTARPEVTRAQVVDDSTSGIVLVYIASAAGLVSGSVVTDVQAAIEKWCTPLCILPQVQSATASYIDVTATVLGSSLPAGFAATIELAIGSYLAALDVGETVYKSKLIQVIHDALPAGVISSVTLTVPAADTTLAAGFVAVPDDVTITEA